MGDERREIEGHVDAGVGAAERLAVQVDHQRQMNLAAVPGLAQFVRRHGDRREGRGWLGVEEAEPLGELRPGQRAQRHVVDQHDEADGIPGFLSAGAHRHVVDDHRHFCFAVDAPGLVGHADRVARRNEGVRATLIDQRIGPEARRHLDAPCLAHQFDVIDVGRAVRPLIGARQRRMRVALVKAPGRHGTVLQRLGQRRQMRRDAGPVVERRLHRAGEERGVGTARQVARDDDQFPVAAAVLQCGEFHAVLFPKSRCCLSN